MQLTRPHLNAQATANQAYRIRNSLDRSLSGEAHDSDGSPIGGPRQLEEAVCRATDEYVRQGQCADARALADRNFHHKMLEQNRRHDTEKAAGMARLLNHEWPAKIGPS
ncbi:hypothetical protein HPB52_014809 [Rhipicephalus sanguineus]|uniref:Uncharacterized protein n=1 Tax=Rhipicephalus sanguineus TaxID=34632 RepID=A0A9D4PFA9_RHISA|nr:hypothetical protein HPB52_014809 [Rhipicephalus sanguineus]